MKNKYFNPKELAHRLKQAIKPGLYALSATVLLTLGYVGGIYNGINKTKAECLSRLRETTHNVKLADSMAESELENAVRYDRNFNDGNSELRDMQFKAAIKTAREKKILAEDALKGLHGLESQIKGIK